MANGTMLNVTVSGVKNWKAREGIGYQATLLVDGVKTAFGTDAGMGGCMDWEVYDEARFRQWAESVGAVDVLHANGMVKCDTPIDIAFAELVDKHEMAKQLRRWCKRSTVFRLPTDKEGEYRTVNRPFTVGVRDMILTKYPNAIIVNELVAGT